MNYKDILENTIVPRNLTDDEKESRYVEIHDYVTSLLPKSYIDIEDVMKGISVHFIMMNYGFLVVVP